MIRRPHVYWFLEDYPDLLESMVSPDPRPGAASNAVILDATKGPIPGFVLLSPDGELRASVPLLGDEPRAELLRAMSEQAPRQVRIGDVQWYVDYDAAVAVARAAHKPLWVHFGEHPG